jgi:hypothetical protein
MTSTWAVPVARKSGAGTVAVSCVGLTYVVVNGDVTLFVFTHCTTEQGRRFVPVTVTVIPGPPAEVEVCDSELIEGGASAAVGVERVKGDAPDVAIELVTVTATGPGNAAWAAGMAAVSCVGLTKVVVCVVPFQLTSASLVKFVPFTVNVKPCELQYGVDEAEVVDADNEVMAGGVPGAVPIVKRTTFETSVVTVVLMFCVGD